MKKWLIGITSFAAIVFVSFYLYLEGTLKPVQSKLDRRAAAASKSSPETSARFFNPQTKKTEITSPGEINLAPSHKGQIQLTEDLIKRVRAELSYFGIQVPEKFQTSWRPGGDAHLGFWFLDNDGKSREIGVNFYLDSPEIGSISDSRNTRVRIDPWIERNITADVKQGLRDKVERLLVKEYRVKIEVKDTSYCSSRDIFRVQYDVTPPSGVTIQFDMGFNRETKDIVMVNNMQLSGYLRYVNGER